MNPTENIPVEDAAAPEGAAVTVETVVWLPIASLTPHETSVRVYGTEEPDDALVESIDSNGVQVPLIVTQDNRIISGSRRRIAAAQARLTEVPVIVRTYADQAAQDEAVLATNRQRKKTNEQMIKEFIEYKRLEEEKAKSAKEGKKARANLPTKEKTRIGEAAARRVCDFGRRSLENGEKVLAAMKIKQDEDDEETVAELRDELNKSIHKGYKRAVTFELIADAQQKANGTSKKPSALIRQLEALCNELVALEIREISPGDQARLRDLATRINAMVNSLPATTPIPYIESAATAEAGNNGDTSAAA